MKVEINFPGSARRRLATHEPDDPDTRRDGDKAGKPQLFRRNGRQDARHPHKKTRGQCIDQPLEDQKEGKTCKQIRHGDRQLPVAGTAFAAGAAGEAGAAPCASLKKRKKSESGDSTMVEPVPLSAPV